MYGKRRRHYRPMAHVIYLLIVFLVASAVLSQASTPEPTADPLSTAEVTAVVPTLDPTDPTPPPETSTPEPEPSTTAPVPTVEATVEVTPIPTVEATVEVTPEATEPAALPDESLAPAEDGGPIIMPLAVQTFCEMEITDAGDSNAYTYGFNAINTSNIASYLWDFGDGSPTSTAQNNTHTYTSAGNFTVTLICTPNNGFPNLTLTGGVSISAGLTANFSVTPSTQFTGVPFTFVTVNTSFGNNLSYTWAVSTDANPANAGAYLYTSTQENISYTYSSTLTPLPLTLYVYLTATDGTGNVSFASQSIVVVPPPPLADFSVTPIVGAAPLTVTATGLDLLAGPIDTVQWDTNGDFGTIEATGFGPHNFTFSAIGTYNITMRYRGPGLAPGVYNTVTRQVVAADAGIPVNADFTWDIIGPSGGGVEVCFTNTSTGPVATAEWDFGDGTAIVSSLASVVCHVYANTNLYQVFLTVRNAAATFSSQAAYFISVTQPPVASFTINPGSNITWGTLISLTNTSTGVYDIIEWDLDGNGSYETTTANPSNIALSQLGAHPIRLRVTDSASGMSSFAEALVTVSRRAVTCDITGNVDVAPGSAAQNYTASATGLTAAGFPNRTINYTWTVTGNGTGLPLSQPGSPLSIDWDTIGFGAFTVQLNGVTNDGAQCSDTITVNHNFDALVCDIAITPSAPQYPDGSSYTLSYSLSGTNGRTVSAVRWYQGNVANPNPNTPAHWTLVGTGTTFPFTNSTSTAGLPRTDNWRIEIDVDNTSVSAGYVPATTRCDDTEQYTVQNWPTLTCDSISGEINPRPVSPDNDDRGFNYTVNLGGLAGRTNISYDWTVDPNDGVIVADGVNPVRIRWTPAALDAGNESLSVVVTLTNPDGTQVNCNVALSNINVQLPSLTCNTPIGDINPTVGETTDYQRDYANDYGRTISAFNWVVTEVAPAAPLTYTPTQHPLLLTFNEPDAEYNLIYNLSVAATTVINPDTSLPYPGTLPASSCTSPALNVNTYAVGVAFECESAIFGDSTPFGASPNYTYSLFMDNTNGIFLRYLWELYDHTGTVLLNVPPDGYLERFTENFDGMVFTEPWTLTELAPNGVDRYVLRVTVSEDDPLYNLTYTCTRSLPLTVGLLDAQYSYSAGSWTNTAMPVGQSICFTDTTTWNPSKPSYATTAWSISGSAANNSLGTNTFNGATQCVSFNTPGTYSITLNQDVAGRVSDSYSLNFTVYGLQNIIANRTGSAFGNTLQSFTATGTNITAGTYNWTFVNSTTAQTLTRNVQNPSLNLAPGVWTATVVGTGPLGNTQAQLNFTLEETGGLVARFAASQYTGIAPMNVCFTDTSVSSGSSISLWEWDLDGNGTFEISSPTQVNPCFTYPNPGVSTTVSLRVTNALFTRTATNTIRTYTLGESLNNFSITPMGGGQYCFTAILAPGVSVVSWDFGDGTPIVLTNQTSICHSYSASGTYFVKMGIDVPGVIERPLTVPPTTGTPPVLAVSHVCTNGTPVFTITNTGGAMTTPDVIQYYTMPGDTLFATDSFQLAAGASQNFSPPAGSSYVRLRTIDTTLVDTASCTNLAVTATCGPNSLPIFTVTNSSVVPMTQNQPWEIRNAANTLITSGTFQINGSGDFTDIAVPAGNNPYDTYTFSSSGVYATLSMDHNCATAPTISVTSVCGDPIVFTVTNTSGANMLVPQDYVVVQGVTTVTSGSFQLNAGGSTTVTLPTGIDPYLPYVLTTSGGFVTAVNYTHNCADPVLTVSSVCGNPIVFTVTNTGGAMLIAQPYTVTQGAATIVSSTYTVAANSSTTITLPGGLDPYLAYVFSSSGAFVTSLTSTHDCPDPVLSVSSVCGSPIVFTVTNTGGAMLIAQPYTVTQGATTVVSDTYTVAANSSTTITLPGGLDPYLAYVFSSSGAFVTSLNTTHDCPEPVLTVSSVCANPIVFTVTNTGANMLTPQAYTITQGVTVVDSGTFTATGSGGTATITLPTGIDPYVPYVFSSSGFITVANYTHDCVNPDIVVTSVCGNPIVFTVTNNSGALLINQPYTITQGVTIVTSGNLNLASGASTTVTLPTGIDPYAPYVFANDGGFVTINVTHDCAEPVITVTSVCGNPIVFTVTNTGGNMLMAQPYSVTQGATTITSGTINVPGGSSTTITLPTGIDPYLPYVFSSSGAFVTVANYTHDCAEPVITVTSVCGDPIVFTVTNTGGNMLMAQPYSVTQGATTITSGTINVPGGSSTTITLPTGIDPYLPYVFSSSGAFVTVANYTHDCADPVITVTSVCGDPIVFTVTNTGGNMLMAQPYSVAQGATTVTSGTINVPGGSSATVTLPTGIDPYLPYVFSSSGAFVTVANFTHDCADPVITVTSVCGDPIVFTVTNTGGNMLSPQPYSVTQGATVVASGALNLPASGTLNIPLPAGIDPYAPYIFSSSGAFVTVANFTHDCADPVITVTSVCGDPIVFTVTNTGAVMLIDQPYTVVSGGSTVASGVLNLAAGASTTVALPSGIDPYAAYLFSNNAGFVPINYTHDCPNPVLVISSTCSNPIAFTLTNTGAPMIFAQPYAVSGGGSTVASGSLLLGTGSSTIVTLSGQNPYLPYTFTSGGFAGNYGMTQDCTDPVFEVTGVCANQAVMTVTNVGGSMLASHSFTLTALGTGADITPSSPNFQLATGQQFTISGISITDARGGVKFDTTSFGIAKSFTLNCAQPTTFAEVSAFEPLSLEQTTLLADVPACGYSCPTFRVYHTDETGDWEIFRLDGADKETQTTFRRNLSYGEGPEVSDVSPSLSPNSEWIVFSSNRDGNWEIYVASTSGDPDSVQRVTSNNFALDTHPVWGPGNFVVFETTRTGSWDLYMIDMSTGRVFPMLAPTLDSNETNASWSSDGSRIVFQSDRADANGVRQMQVYEYVLATGEITRLSDGTTTDVDPQFGNASTQIVFRRYTDTSGGNSTLWVMDADGSNARQISDEAGDATNAAWSPSDRYIAYQSDLDGDLDIYTYEIATGITRQISDNAISDYAPAWTCDELRVFFSTDVTGQPDLFEAEVQPITDGPINLELDAERLTFELSDDIYPEQVPSNEVASREGQTVTGPFGQQTVYLRPDMTVTEVDISIDEVQREDWRDPGVCPAS